MTQPHEIRALGAIAEQITGVFQVRIGKEIYTYSKVEDIPETFDNLIRFEPDVPPPPHSLNDHELMSRYPVILAELMKRETNASRNPNR